MSFRENFRVRWRYFWVKRSGWHGPGRCAAWLAALGTDPYHAREFLAYYGVRGFVAPTASVVHPELNLGRNVYLGDRVYVYCSDGGGPIDIEDRVCVYGETILQTGSGGRLRIGAETHIQHWCNFSAHVGQITIGARVEIAPSCSFYSYNHGMAAGADIMGQPFESKGGIRIGDGAWLGHGVVVLDGVEIGAGAVIAAHSVVVHSIPAQAIAAGSPAKVLRFRE